MRALRGCKPGCIGEAIYIFERLIVSRCLEGMHFISLPCMHKPLSGSCTHYINWDRLVDLSLAASLYFITVNLSQYFSSCQPLPSTGRILLTLTCFFHFSASPAFLSCPCRVWFFNLPCFSHHSVTHPYRPVLDKHPPAATVCVYLKRWPTFQKRALLNMCKKV